MQPVQIVLALAGLGAAFYFFASDAAKDERQALLQKTARAADAVLPSGSLNLMDKPSGGKVSEPAQLLKGSLRGHHLRSPGMAASGDQIYFVTQAIAGLPPLQAKQVPVPAGATIVPTAADCMPRKPQDGEKVFNIHVGSSNGRKTGVEAFSTAQLAKDATYWLSKGYRERDMVRAVEKASPDSAPLRTIDVALTEKSAPVYLILHSTSGGILWNIHQAPGTRLAHVAVVTPAASGLNLPDPDISYEFLQTRKLGCYVFATRQPTRDWGFVKNGRMMVGDYLDEVLDSKPAGTSWTDYGASLNTRDSTIDTILKNFGYFETYSAWFQERFGLPADLDDIGYDEVAHVLAGPLPQGEGDMAVYTPITGAQVLVSQDDLVVAGPRDARNVQIKQAQMDLVLQAAGRDDLAALLPAHREATQ